MIFAEIQTKVLNYLNLDANTAPLAGDWVNIAMRKLERENWKCMEQRWESQATSDTYVTMPPDYKQLFWLKVKIGTRYYDLERVTISQAFFRYPDEEEGEGRPLLFAIMPAHHEILVRPNPDTQYVYHAYYYAYTDEMANDGDTNWWTDYAWEILLYGALLEAEAYIKNDPRVETWRRMFEDAVARLRLSEIYERWSGQTQAIAQQPTPSQPAVPV